MKRFRTTQYLVDTEGKIYNERTKRFIKPILKKFNKQGERYFVGLYIEGKQKNFFYHRVIAEVLIPNPNNLPHVNHIDGNGLNNAISNLEWCTARDNNIHAITTGLRPCKLNQQKADEIRQLIKQGVKSKTIMEIYGIKGTLFYKIKNNQSWTYSND
jgi:hypothetical protein